MPLADAYIQGIKKFEGYTPRASWDYKQHSVGYGTRARYPGEVIDQAEAERRLQAELASARDHVRRFKPDLTPGQEAALTSLTYNAGPGWQKAGLGAAIQSGDWETAKNRFLQYNKAGGQVLPGLASRRQQEAAWIDGTSVAPAGQYAQPIDRGPPTMPLGDASPMQQQPQGNWLDRITSNPLFLMGAGVLGAPNIGQGIMQGVQTSSAMKRASAAERKEAELFPLQKQLLQAQASRAAMGAEQPSNVREWQFYNMMTPEQKQQYLTMKRANPSLDLGTSYAIPNQAAPGGPPVATFEKDIAGEARAKRLGQEQGQTISEMPAAQQRIGLITQGLDRLEQTATALLGDPTRGVKEAPGLQSVAGGLYQAYVPNVSKDALNAQTELENLKVKISGQVLQSMRDMSKTGGAVGQVTEREWPRLENMIANLDPKQGIEQFRKNLAEVVTYAQQVKQMMRQAYEAEAGFARTGQMNIGGQAVEAMPTQQKADPLGIR